ncbi:DUF3592 domain-containing protein [Actinoplanes sp. GCM10030250]|uniref:DUF3592 domain-containing protein n=1 Tax=Actinoplanes sp. GCM10030250 TaxID=3273376 RepID=UPI0036128F3D
MELWRKLAIVCALSVMAVAVVGSGLVDGYRNVAIRGDWVKTTAALREFNTGAWLVEYRWEGRIRTSWTDRVAGEPPGVGDFLPVLVDPDDPGRVATPAWVDRATPRILGKIGFGLLIALGVVLMLRHMLRAEEPARPILRPRNKQRPINRRRPVNRQRIRRR